MKIILKEIDISNGSCQNDLINTKSDYIVNYGGKAILGKFKKQWYGWNFDWFGSVYAGLQLNTLDKVYEAVFEEEVE
jgi:hypothetical protein